MARLERLEFVSRKIFAGKMRGERRSKRKGESVEFADYRPYVAGDDLRFLDWNIYGRLDRLFLKLFLQEEDLHVGVMLDASGSMDWGTPAKGFYAKQVAAALGYIGLCNFDRIGIYPYADGLKQPMSGVRGRNMMNRVIDYLHSIEFEGGSDLTLACKQYAIRYPQPGLLIVLSDFFDKGGYEQALRYLLGRHLDVYVVQLLSPQELNPNISGDLRLVDVEDDDTAEVTVGRALLQRYKQNLEAYCLALRTFCTQRDISYLFADTDVPFDQLVLKYLRRRGLLK